MHVSHATQPRHRWTRHSQRHLTLLGPTPLHSSHGTWACRARREGKLPLSIWLWFPVVPQRNRQAGHVFCPLSDDLSGEKLLIGTREARIHPFNQASNLFLWSGDVYWKTIMWEGPRLSSRGIGHWTRLTFGFCKSLGVKWRGQHWASSMLGRDQSMCVSVCVCVCICGMHESVKGIGWEWWKTGMSSTLLSLKCLYWAWHTPLSTHSLCH